MNTLLSSLADHLWQSTICAAVAAFLAFLFRKHRGDVRYWIWMTASLKFLLPFSLLVALGSRLHPSSGALSPTRTGEPFMPILLGGVMAPLTTAARVAPSVSPTHAIQTFLTTLLPLIWACGALWILCRWWREWHRIRISIARAMPIHLETPIRALSSPELREPGVFGLWRPVLLLPEEIIARLTPQQLRALLEHELYHVRRRDNLAAALHMIVEAVFWFHLLVWWLGRRIMEERERSCDEHVLQSGSDPLVYAEGILKVCELSLESPLGCLSGITGANLKKRISAIMTNRETRNLRAAGKLLLAAAGAALLAVPLIVGISRPPLLHAQEEAASSLKFEVASVKPNKSDDFRKALQPHLEGDRFITVNVPLGIIVAMAYNVPFQYPGGSHPRFTGLRDKIMGERFDIEAKAEPGALPKGPASLRNEKMRAMLRALLADRFKLQVRRETSEMPVYALIVGPKGPHLQESTSEDPAHMLGGGMGQGMHLRGISMSDLVTWVANWSDRPIIDKTGLTGLYDIETEGWVPMFQRVTNNPESAESRAMSDPTRPTLFMVFERLGLKLDSQKAPVDVYVIEHIERPTEN
jgi:bla regulator protein BlaR1